MPSPMESVRRRLARLTGRIHALPVLVLMPYGGCNGRCVMCDVWKGGNEPVGELSAADLAGHLPALRTLRLRRVALSGGEPLLHPNLWGLCASLSTLGARFSLLTNGLLLESHAVEVDRWCSDVVVSLDGGRTTHDAVRNVAGAYDRLERGVAALKALDPSLPVAARCVVQRRNFRRLADTIVAAHELGLDGVSFLAADVSSAAFNRATPWDGGRAAEVALSRAEVAEFAEVVEEVVTRFRADLASGFVAERPEKLRRLVDYYRALNGEGDFPEPVCNAPWVSAVIEADGSVRPCFFRPPLGNLHERPLLEILNSPQAVAFRRGLDVRRDPTCRRCVCTLSLGPRAEV